MVLEDATATDTFRDDSSPSSDTDTYSSSPGSGPSSGPQSLQIDTAKLWKPLPILGPLMGYSSENLGLQISRQLTIMNKIVQRPFTPPEIDAVSFHTSKAFAISSYGAPLGTAAGYWRYSNAKSSYRFPFWAPNMEKFNPQKFGPLKGAQAQSAWHALRLVAYTSLGSWFGRLIVGTYAATVAATGTRLDTRLTEVVEAIRKMGNEEANRRRKADGPSPSPVPVDMGTAGDQAQDASAMAMSSAGGLAEAKQQGAYAVQNRAPAYQTDNVSSQPAEFDFDDASPTAGNAAIDTSVSAWERLRKGESPAPQPRAARQAQVQVSRGDAWAGRRGGEMGLDREGRDGSTVGDRADFSRNDDEKQRAREAAQREFDARLERERNGGDFGEGGKWK